jgi:hypothetical protein
MLHPGPAEHDGAAPALIRSICGSLSRSAAKAFPPNNKDIRQTARDPVISSSQKRTPLTVTRGNNAPI